MLIYVANEKGEVLDSFDLSRYYGLTDLIDDVKHALENRKPEDWTVIPAISGDIVKTLGLAAETLEDLGQSDLTKKIKYAIRQIQDPWAYQQLREDEQRRRFMAEAKVTLELSEQLTDLQHAVSLAIIAAQKAGVSLDEIDRLGEKIKLDMVQCF